MKKLQSTGRVMDPGELLCMFTARITPNGTQRDEIIVSPWAFGRFYYSSDGMTSLVLAKKNSYSSKDPFLGSLRTTPKRRELAKIISSHIDKVPDDSWEILDMPLLEEVYKGIPYLDADRSLVKMGKYLFAADKLAQVLDLDDFVEDNLDIGSTVYDIRWGIAESNKIAPIVFRLYPLEIYLVVCNVYVGKWEEFGEVQYDTTRQIFQYTPVTKLDLV